MPRPSHYNAFTDAKVLKHTPSGLGKGPAGLGMLVLTPEGRLVFEHQSFLPEATSHEAELAAILNCLNRLLDRQRNAGDVQVRVFTDSQSAYIYLKNPHWSKNPKLYNLAQQIRTLEQSFRNVEYFLESGKNRAIRRAETLGRHALEAHDYKVAHRASKGNKESAVPIWDPFKGEVGT